MFRVLVLITGLILPLAGSGCAIVEVGVRNPVIGLESVAVAPFFNLSQERTVDGREFALDYYAELQKVPGFEVLPVGVTERAMVENGISLAGPEDAVRLAKILDVDAVVVGAVTDYDPYNPRIGLKVAWYSPRQWLFLPNENPNNPAFSRSADAPVKRPGRPCYTTSRAQSPDDSGEWVSAESPQANVEEGNWQSVNVPAGSPEILLADAGLSQGQRVLPTGTSLLVPVDDAGRESRQYRTVSYQDVELSDPLTPAPPAESVAPVQDNNVAPRVAFPGDGVAAPLPLATAPEKAFEKSDGREPRRLTRPKSEKAIRDSLTDQPANDNPFNRHLLPPPSVDSELSERHQTNVPEIAEQPGYQPAPRIAVSGPELPGGGEKKPKSPPLPPDPQLTEPEPQTAEPIMQTPLFPATRPENPPSLPETELPTNAPALIFDDQVLMPPSEFDSNEPLMAYVRLFDATDRRLIARLSDYLELTGQLRSGDLKAYMKRSEFFRKFTAHVMISEMLQLHGGEARRQLVLKTRQYR